MEKKLSEMSLEELWKLFPIYLTEHQPYWKEWYTDEESFLKNRVPKIERISHIGSTAINSIYAKPIIDILVEISKDYCLSDYKEVIVKSGYTCMSETSDRLSFNKGYTEEGFAERVFHLHLRYIGDNDELYFRDYLIEHANIAIEYERMKLKLWKKYEFNNLIKGDSPAINAVFRLIEKATKTNINTHLLMPNLKNLLNYPHEYTKD